MREEGEQSNGFIPIDVVLSGTSPSPSLFADSGHWLIEIIVLCLFISVSKNDLSSFSDFICTIFCNVLAKTTSLSDKHQENKYPSDFL